MRNKSKNNTASDLSEKFEAFKNQFRNLDPKDPSLWPLIPRVFLFIAIAVGVLIGAWFAYLNTLEEDLKAEQQKRNRHCNKSFPPKCAKLLDWKPSKPSAN